MRFLECTPPAEPWLPVLEASTDVVQLHKPGWHGCEKLVGEKEPWEAPLGASLLHLGTVPKLHLSPSAEVHGVPKSDTSLDPESALWAVGQPPAAGGTARGQLCSPCSSTGHSGTPTPACPAGGFPSLTEQPALGAVLAALIPVPFTGFHTNLQEHPSAWYRDPWINVTLSRPKNKEHCSIKKNPQATKLVTKLILFQQGLQHLLLPKGSGCRLAFKLV